MEEQYLSRKKIEVHYEDKTLKVLSDTNTKFEHWMNFTTQMNKKPDDKRLCKEHVVGFKYDEITPREELIISLQTMVDFKISYEDE